MGNWPFPRLHSVGASCIGIPFIINFVFVCVGKFSRGEWGCLA
uniref:Uncharacterized protein n=1 Tax=Rhizophora mucronata TaxID=61149 RepID=A0A2P2PW83_RHIMU